MLLPMMGLMIFCVALAPFAGVYAAFVPQARNLASFTRFYLGSFFWPFMVAAGFELLELQNIWLDGHLGLVALLAPFGGALFDWVWRQLARSQAGPQRLIPALVTTSLMVAGFFFHFAYLANMDLNPTFDEQSLKGTWKGREGQLVLAEGGWSRDGDWGLIVDSKRYRVIRSFGQLSLTEKDKDPDAMTVLYRKLPSR